MGKIVNLERINPIKRQGIRQGMEFIDRMNAIEPVVDKIIVFGSAITEDCSEDSDIDLCIFSPYDSRNTTYRAIRGKLMDQIDDVCDILRFDHLNDRFKHVVQEGVTVYES